MKLKLPPWSRMPKTDYRNFLEFAEIGNTKYSHNTTTVRVISRMGITIHSQTKTPVFRAFFSPN